MTCAAALSTCCSLVACASLSRGLGSSTSAVVRTMPHLTVLMDSRASWRTWASPVLSVLDDCSAVQGGSWLHMRSSFLQSRQSVPLEQKLREWFSYCNSTRRYPSAKHAFIRQRRLAVSKDVSPISSSPSSLQLLSNTLVKSCVMPPSDCGSRSCASYIHGRLYVGQH